MYFPKVYCVFLKGLFLKSVFLKGVFLESVFIKGVFLKSIFLKCYFSQLCDSQRCTGLAAVWQPAQLDQPFHRTRESLLRAGKHWFGLPSCHDSFQKIEEIIFSICFMISLVLLIRPEITFQTQWPRNEKSWIQLKKN